MNEDLLRRHQRFELAGQGFTEEFLQPILGLGRTVAVLTRPTGPSLSMGWVVCHAYGIEQIHLTRLDVIAARELARAGFSVLRFHGQGYGDSDSPMDAVSLSSHLAECADAVELLREQGIPDVGTMGSRFGGMVAALLAERMSLPMMALWEPVVRGKQYVRELLRTQVVADMVAAGEGGGASPMQQLEEQLMATGSVNIRGFPLTRAAHDEISAVDLVTDLGSFSGSSLVMAASRTSKPGPAVSKLADHLTSLGGDCQLEVIEDPNGTQFGQFRWRAVEGGRSKKDMQLELNEKMSAATARWATHRLAPATAGAGEVR